MFSARAALLFGAGFVAGSMNSIAGGGTIVTFPALILAGLGAIDANATSTVALLPGALAGVFGYRQNISAVAPWIKRFALASLLGGLLGGILLTRTPAKIFEWLVPFLILFATLLFMSQSFLARFFSTEKAASPPGARWLAAAIFFQFAVAVYGGYFGAGIGILMLASLGMLGLGHIHEMNTVKNVLGFLINIVAALYFVVSGLIHWPAAGIMALGAIGGGFSGAHFAQKIPQAVVRHLITGIGFTLAALMFVKQFTK